jgi:uncharacterized protein YndB with AHSA1/START domain
MAAIKHELWIDAPVEKVYPLLATPDGMSSWWDRQTEVQTDDGPVWEHSPRMLVTARIPNELFKWKCISRHAANVPASSWSGTSMSFAFADRASSAVASEKWAREVPVQTVLSFEHEGWDETSRYFAFCAAAGEKLR